MSSFPLTLGWQDVPVFSPDSLARARQQLHRATQLVAMPGRDLSPGDSPEESASLDWLSHRRSLAGRWIEGRFRALLNFPAFLLILETPEGRHRALPLDGRTYSEAFSWLEQNLEYLSVPKGSLSRMLPYEMPGSTRSNEEPFTLIRNGSFETLGYWLSEAKTVLTQISLLEPGSSEICYWPQHVDLATTIHRDSEPKKSLRVGLSLGDAQYDEPYFYLKPWPVSDGLNVGIQEFPGGGHWHHQEWFGAVLTASQLTSTPGRQADNVASFFGAALSASKGLLGFS